MSTVPELRSAWFLACETTWAASVTCLFFCVTSGCDLPTLCLVVLVDVLPDNQTLKKAEHLHHRQSELGFESVSDMFDICDNSGSSISAGILTR